MEERVVSPGANSPRFHTIRYLEDDGNVSESAQSDDSLDRLLQNYTINLMPKDARFKLRKNIGDKMIIGATCSTPVHLSRTPIGPPRVSLLVKPVDKSKWWNKWWSKAELGTGSINVRSDKFTILKYFRVQVELGYGTGIRSPLRWRVDTIWNPRRRLLHKQSADLYKRANTSIELRPHFHVDVKLPHAEGGDFDGEEDNSNGGGVDVGHCHVSMPLVEIVCKL